MKPLRIAIVGCGRMGKQHAASCQRLGAQVRVLCDSDLSRAQDLAQSCAGAEVIAEGSRIDWSAIDAAFFCTPPFARGPVEKAAALAGVAIFMEKPIGVSHAAAIEILDAAKSTNAITCVGYMNRYRASVQQARSLTGQEGLLGVACHWVGSVYRVAWWGRRELSGGQMNEQCTHYFDLVRYFCGEIREVTAMAQPGPAGDERNVDTAAAVICRTAAGALATLYASCAADTKQIGIQLFTPLRQISLDGWSLELRGTEVAVETDIFEVEAAAFLAAVRSGDRSLILSDLADAMQTQRVVDAVVRASTSKRWETVTQSVNAI